jgi:predicted AAA+ superfamily ATPase
MDSKNRDESLSTYILLYLNEEIKQEGLVRNLGEFSRFMETISFSHGSVLNISNVAREASVKQTTAQGYVEILRDLMLAHYLPIFTKRAKRHLISHPKFYYFDSGVFTKLRPAGPLDRTEEIAGAALEGFILQNLLAFNEYSGNENKIYYWRTKSGTEVDFVIYGKEFLAIEVKHAGRVSNKDLKGLKAFREDYPEASLVLLYRGTERLLIDGILCLPCTNFLLNLKPKTKIMDSIFNIEIAEEM